LRGICKKIFEGEVLGRFFVQSLYCCVLHFPAMAKLTISDAARVAGVARSTLHRAIKQGRLSVDPDGRIDTAELLRAGYTLQRSVQQEKPGALQDATPPLQCRATGQLSRRNTVHTHLATGTRHVAYGA
jgi:hypothetical protein